jgi:hypothetical protein
MRDAMAVIFVVMSIAVVAFLGNENIRRHNAFIEDVADFKAEMEKFKNKGGRNTSSMGSALCERVNTLEIINGLRPEDCKSIYGE